MAPVLETCKKAAVEGERRFREGFACDPAFIVARLPAANPPR